jgi:hypothetical protein
MKESPIIFGADMVAAILRGDKTQTRRVIKPQPPAEIEEFLPADPEGFWGFNHDNRPTLCIHCPYGEIGDRLWLREAWSYYEHETLFDCIRYKADGYCRKPDFARMTEEQCGAFEMHCDGCGCADHRWRSPIHMPRWASRITLEIAGLRVERLQDISEEDAQAEGVTESIVLPGDCGSFVASFGYLWESIHGAGSWAENPWVWVIEFKRVGGEG